MMTIRYRALMIFLILFIATGIPLSHAENKKPEGKTGDEIRDGSLNLKNTLLPDKWSRTEHVLKIGNSELRYTATAGVLPIKVDGEGTECKIFFIYYNLQHSGNKPRPLTFVFNGGPGASSAYLHLAALGPKRIFLGRDGKFPVPPGKLVDNMHTWLRFTDLVFIDPVGTGYSRCVSSKGKPERGKAEAEVWGVRNDLVSLSKFIRLFLTRTNRWLSPKFIAGESYGGFRVAALSDMLQSDYGISLNGVVLISPALEFGLLERGEYRLLPWVITIPSYAATARFHGMAQGSIPGKEDPRIALKDVESFALKDLLPALAMGNTKAIDAQLSSYIGLPVSMVDRLQARIPVSLFSKKLLHKPGRLISLYDGSFTAIDPDPSSPMPPSEDPLLIQINTLLTAGMNSYVRKELKFKTDMPYEVLNKEVSQKWNWRSGLEWGQGYVGVAENLKRGMSMNKDLKVFIAHGVFDLVTPYFGSVIVIRQMSLDPAIKHNLILKVYEGGHMFYTNDVSRKMFFKDARQFYNQAMSGN